MQDQNAQRIRRRAEVQNLQLLVWLRWFAIAGMTLAVLFAQFLLQVTLPIWEIALLIGFLIVVNLASALRLRHASSPIARAVVADLMVDVVALTMLLFLTGGATNPFTGLFILQAIVAAFLLPPIEAGVIFIATVVAQFWLLGNGLPLNLPMSHVQTGPNQFDLHLQGMFLSFFFSSALAVLFILGIRDNLRQRDARLERLAEQMEEEKVVLRFGLLAGTAAHDLGTPLTNLAVILDDWQDLGTPPPDLQRQQIAVMQQAVATCRERISNMLRAAGKARLEEAHAADPHQVLSDLAQDWNRLNPGVAVTLTDRRDGKTSILADILLVRAIGNLLDNAAEAGARHIAIDMASSDQITEITIADDGPGFPPAILRGDEAAMADDGTAAHGLGLVLVRSVLRRIGGQISLGNGKGGGARVTIRLPGIVAHG